MGDVLNAFLLARWPTNIILESRFHETWELLFFVLADPDDWENGHSREVRLDQVKLLTRLHKTRTYISYMHHPTQNYYSRRIIQSLLWSLFDGSFSEILFETQQSPQFLAKASIWWFMIINIVGNPTKLSIFWFHPVVVCIRKNMYTL
jgi:hypothetical protein